MVENFLNGIYIIKTLNVLVFEEVTFLTFASKITLGKRM